MGKVVSRMNVFGACRDAGSGSPGETKKEEDKRTANDAPKSTKPLPEPPVDISSSDVQIDDDLNDLTQIGFRNDDNYFSPEEAKRYRALYASEKVNPKPIANIKYESLGTVS